MTENFSKLSLKISSFSVTGPKKSHMGFKIYILRTAPYIGKQKKTRDRLLLYQYAKFWSGPITGSIKFLRGNHFFCF